MKLELSKTEVAAVVDYIYQHVRASPTGTGYKVWQKMFKFLNEEKVPSETPSPSIEPYEQERLF